MAMLQTLKQERQRLLNEADDILKSVEGRKTGISSAEQTQIDNCLSAVNKLNSQIAAVESRNTLRSSLATEGGPHTLYGGDGSFAHAGAGDFQPREKRTFSKEYFSAFYEFLSSGGQKISAATYEGSNAAGGYAVPVIVDRVIVPLAPAETGVRAISQVIPTSSDIKVPIKSAFGTGIAIKTESGGATNLFSESDPTLGQFTLSAFMLGGVTTASFELLQDITQIQTFLIDDLLKAISVYEDGKFISGSGTGQPQGLLGNVGAGVTGVVADGSGNLLPNTALFDVTGTLNAVYHPNASWLMSRATGTQLRKQQMASNLFEPLWTRVGNRDYLLGYPVQYSAAMPSIAAGNTPVLFGDFKSGYLIGERGGAGINVKILDQPLATAGQIQLLAYERVDGRVRRSEAIQGITLHT